MAAAEKTTSRSEGQQAPDASSISLPKGGGAVHGIGEKFAANPVAGTGSLSIPLATSPGCSGFGLQPSLSYDSGSGNGPFGFCWSLSPPAITRKTDKGLPRYRDAEESDVFVLSGAEDLVPVNQYAAGDAANVDLGQASERNRARPSGATSGVTTEYLYDLLYDLLTLCLTSQKTTRASDHAACRTSPMSTTLGGHITRIEDGVHNGIGAPEER